MEYYSYTKNGYLLNGSGPWGSIYYGTDANGNITQKSLTAGGTTTDEYFGIATNSNRLVNVSDNSSVTRTFGHDASGNIINDTDAATSFAKDYTFNAAGQLSVVVAGGQFSAEYAYDYLSRLSARYVASGNQTTHYVHDLAGNIIAEHDGAGAVTREYIWLDARPVAVVDHGGASPVIYHVHTDHLDRPVLMTDASQTVVWDAIFLPFGGVHSITGSASLDQRFPGQWFQLETGLHYNWHRHYDPTTGRYLQADLLGMPDGPNRFAYVNNSPQMYVDPTGENIIGKVLRYVVPKAWNYCKRLLSKPKPNLKQPQKPNGIPDDWVATPSKKGGGTKYSNPKNPHDNVRVMPGNPNSPNPAQRTPYVKRTMNGRPVDSSENPVNSKSPEAHIPLDRFKFD